MQMVHIYSYLWYEKEPSGFRYLMWRNCHHQFFVVFSFTSIYIYIYIWSFCHYISCKYFLQCCNCAIFTLSFLHCLVLLPYIHAILCVYWLSCMFELYFVIFINIYYNFKKSNRCTVLQQDINISYHDWITFLIMIE